MVLQLPQRRPAEALTLSGGMVAVAKGEGRQVGQTPAAVGVVELGEVPGKHGTGPAVGGDVVVVDQQPMLLGRHHEEAGTQQQPCGEVQGGSALLLQPGRPDLIRLAIPQPLHLQRQGPRRMDDLQQGGPLHPKGGTQGRMALDQGGQCLDKGRGVETALQMPQQRQVVGRQARLQLMQEPKPRLGKGRGVRLAPSGPVALERQGRRNGRRCARRAERQQPAEARGKIHRTIPHSGPFRLTHGSDQGGGNKPGSAHAWTESGIHSGGVDSSTILEGEKSTPPTLLEGRRRERAPLVWGDLGNGCQDLPHHEPR